MEHAQGQCLVNIHHYIAQGTFSDIQIVCKDGTTAGSRLILAALSTYFRAMLTSDMTESRTSVFELPSVSLSVFKDILKMCFCRMNLVNENNCVQVLDAAEMMQLDHIKQLCNTHLEEGLVLSPENCLNWWRFLKLYNFMDLSKRAFVYLTDNLANFVETEHGIQLSKTELLEIISKEDLNCKEDNIVKLVMKWIEHNQPDEDDMKCIFEKVRLDIADPKFLIREVVCSSVLSKNKSVQEMVQDVLCKSVIAASSGSARLSLAVSSHVRFKRFDVFILQRNNMSLLSCFTSDDKWEDVPRAPVDPGAWYSAASLDDKIYITGGNYKPTCTLIYDTTRKVWRIGPDLNQKRNDHCMATARSKVYAIGGVYSNSIEEISDSVKHWQVVGDLGRKRYYAFPVTVCENILVMGGGIGRNTSDVIQCFNTRTHSISTLKTRLPCHSILLRGYVHLPDVYLLDIHGNVMHVQVIDRDGEIQIKKKFTAKWKSFRYCFGVVHRDGSLLCFTKDGIWKFSLAEGKEEENTFPRPHTSGSVYSVLPLCPDNR
ncbi:kelch-like protein 5 [Gigantopelta aegis]|uniref:kelch-like protein 5 n=1 Tax=Gigantopelta aegis TaxID=1735272 RepID=UPI001B88B7B0|nr:kelch-like protein 5 [Gigantopelta aegis]